MVIKTKKGYLFLIMVFILGLILVPIVSAESYTGTLDSSEFGEYTSYTGAWGGSGSGNNQIRNLTIGNIENSGGLQSWILFPHNNEGSADALSWEMTIGNNVSAQTPFVAYIGNTRVGSGDIGFQRLFDSGGTPQKGYIWLVFNQWNAGSLSGTKLLNLTYDDNALWRLRYGSYGWGGTLATKTWINNGNAGSYVISTKYPFHNAYTFTSNTGLGISGFVNKSVSGNYYSSKVYITNETSGVVIANEGSYNTNDFSFQYPVFTNMLLSVVDNKGTWYNRSLVFSPAINPTATPTPTPALINITGTPTPTPTPQGGFNGTTDFNVRVTVYDYINMTPISGLSIGLRDSNDALAGWYNVTAASGSYIFNGYGAGGNKPFVDHHVYLFTFSKTGYVTETRTFTYTAGLNDIGYYLQTSAYTPTASNFVLGVKLFSTTTGEIESPLSGTITLSNQSSAWTSVSSNPSAGVVMFSGLNPAFSYKVDAALTGYQYATSYFSSASSMAGSTQWLYVYLAPTQQPASNYQLSVSPSMGTYNDAYTLKLTGDLSNAIDVSFKFYSNNQQFMSFTSGAGYADYHYIGGAWKQWDGSAWSIASSLPQIVSVTIPSSHGSDTSYTVTAYITSSTGTTYQASSNLNIISSGSNECWVYAWGGATAIPTQLYPFNYYVLNQNTGTWNNGTFTISQMANLKLYYNTGTKLQYQISSAGYGISALKSYTVPTTNECVIDAVLYPDTPLLPIGNTTLYATVRQAASGNLAIGLPISSAKVTLSDGQTAYTSSMGQVNFVVMNGTFYSATAEKQGFTSASSSTTTGAGNNVINFVLLPITVTTPIGGNGTRPSGVYVTPTSQLVPTLNWTAGAACGAPSGNATLKEIMMNYMACNGVETKEAQSALIGLGIMVFAGALLAKYGKGMGAIAGVVAGAAVSFYMQLFPFWVFIFVCVAAGIVFAGKIFGAGDK